MLSCEFCEISKNTIFTEHLWATASVIIWMFTDICIVIVSTMWLGGSDLQPYLKLLTVFAKKLQALSHAALLNKKLQHSWFQVISNSNKLFEDIPAMSLTHNKSLITYNSHNGKLIWKCIHLPRCCFEQNLVEVYFHIFIFFD